MTEVSGTFFVFFYSLGLASPSQKSSPPTMSSDGQFEKWLEGPPSTDQVRSRLDDYTTKIQDIARVALDPDSAPFAEAKVKQVRANSNLIQQHLQRTEILAEWLLENIDEAADITPSRQTAETYLEYVSALDLYHRAEEIQEELVALHNRAADTTLRELDLSLQTLSKETSQMKRKLREMESYPPLVELQQQITELIRKIERIRAKEALALAQKLEEQKREDALKVQLESARTAAAAHPHSSSTTAVSTLPGSRHLSLASKIKLEVPKFDGNPLHWFQFWGDFEELIASNTSLTNIEKFTYLNQALLTPESQKIAAEAGGPRKNFDKSVKALKASYEDKRLIYQRSVQKFVETGRDLGLNRKDLNSLKSSLNGIETTMEQCEGDTLDQMKAAIMLLKFGRDLEAAWKRETTKLKEPPSTKVVVDFLDDQLTSISGTREEFDHIQPPSHPPSGKHNKKTVHRISAPTELGSCPACSSTGHSLARCNGYRNWGLKRKNDLVKAHNLCYNCLQAGHRISACTNKGTCRECKRRHHTTLHDPAKVVTPPAATTPASTNSTPSTEEVSNRVIRQPLLAAATASPMTLHEVHPTAAVTLWNQQISQPTRTFIDHGSAACLINESLVKKLKLPKCRNEATVRGIVGRMNLKYTVEVSVAYLSSASDLLPPAESFPVTCYVVKDVNVCANIPDYDNPDLLQFMHNKAPWADPREFSQQPIELLLSTSAVAKGRVAQTDVLHRDNINLVADLYKIGWVINGNMPGPRSAAPVIRAVTLLDKEEEEDKDEELKADLTRLWQLEEVGHNSSKHPDPAEAHYLQTSSRQESGRYVVSLPRKDPAPELGFSRPTAFHRFVWNERSLQKKGKLPDYQKALWEYIRMDHSEVIPKQDVEASVDQTFYLPSHGVVKANSTTTKLRVVFDGSAKTSTKVSLNDTLLPTPNLYSLLTDVLLEFRTHHIAVTGDIHKMFREIALDKRDWDMHRFLAKDPDTNRLHNCRMKRLTFGIASSPFLATRVLHQMADDYQDKYPEAAAMVKKSFYVDDCLTGANTPEEALQKLQDLCSLVAEGQMVLRKWRSNSTQVLQQIPEKLRETSDLTLCDPAGSLKTLGIHWSTETDAFFVATPELTEEGLVTKRIISSACAKTFDILGWYSPALIQAKSLLQQLWIAGRAWDDPAPEDVADKFITWRKELKHIRLHAVPRKLTQNNLSPVMSMQLHGFTDASETGYGAVVYARILHQDATITVTMVAAKARLAPKKSVTIPRLELLGSLMLSKLLPKIASILQVEEANTYYWIDSQIVLAWIQKDPQQLKTFVQNRVSAIQSATHKSRWNYVRTHQNPADHASRGLSPRQTVQNHLWWKGPPWLMSPPHLWPSSLEQSPISLQQQQHSALPELKVRKMTTVTMDLPLWSKFSSMTKLARVLAYCLRFVHHKHRIRDPLLTHPPALSSEELKKAHLKIVQHLQRKAWPDEFQRLSSKQPVLLSSPTAKLNPYLDSSGVIRVGGRLSKSKTLPAEVQHPILLPKTPLVKSFLLDFHHKHHHPGPSAMEALRISPARPFDYTGVDFAGPFDVKRGHTRKPVLVKAYACLFVCMSTKAVHIDCTEDLSTASFMLCFERFINRRGFPWHVYSDNGSNFIGAARTLGTPTQLPYDLQDFTAKTADLQAHGVSWHFIPARSPHCGGIWESGIRRMKEELRKTLHHFTPTAAEFHHLLITAEAVLNSRPLLPISLEEANGAQVITPGHFLIGRPIRAHPQDIPPPKDGLKKVRWSLLRAETEQLWKRWHTAYVQSLQSRQKWTRPQPNISVGDIVLLKDDSLKLHSWPLAKVTEVSPGPDGVVRVVTLTLPGGRTFTRHVRHLVPLMRASDCSPCPGGENVQDPRDGFGDYHSSSPERSQQRSQQP